ncbi:MULTISPECIES: excisionase family DNA-binding protein [unclassified Bradyrhizobium]|uniref:excisionase family DNA-binding protein n=1 Tax=unclassified Bradyrhizobium TaxID=2631580 RepID=UPI0029170F8F|nr:MULTISPECIES: excisionase family DNA-binding protein [unclassified Bradyrhizobium]
MKNPRYDLTSVLARLDQLEATNRQLEINDKEKSQRIADLEEIIAKQFAVLPPALAERTITPKEAAYELGVTEQRVSQLIRSGRLRAVKCGGRQRVELQSVASHSQSAKRA